jgi:hypothetical protein
MRRDMAFTTQNIANEMIGRLMIVAIAHTDVCGK